MAWNVKTCCIYVIDNSVKLCVFCVFSYSQNFKNATYPFLWRLNSPFRCSSENVCLFRVCTDLDSCPKYLWGFVSSCRTFYTPGLGLNHVRGFSLATVIVSFVWLLAECCLHTGDFHGCQLQRTRVSTVTKFVNYKAWTFSSTTWFSFLDCFCSRPNDFRRHTKKLREGCKKYEICTMAFAATDSATGKPY